MKLRKNELGLQQFDVENRAAGNSTYPNGAVSCSKDSFVVKVPPFAKPQNVTSKPIRLHNNDQTDDN